jgi:copper chaperone
MSNFTFKTTINCNGCIIKTKRVLDIPEIENWEVDVDNPDKILTIVTEKLSPEDIIRKLKMIGYEAEEIN